MPFNIKSHLSSRLPFFKRVMAGVLVCSVVGGVVGVSDLHGQTLFARPDTTANYAGYRHIEECLAAAERLTMETLSRQRDSQPNRIWWDTVQAWVARELRKGRPPEKEFLKRRPEVAIQAIRTCLATFDADTATFLSKYSALQIVKILLVAHRDTDAHQFAERALDSMRKESEKEYKIMLVNLMDVYRLAQPRRFEPAINYYERFMAARQPGDSNYRAIDATLIYAGLLGGHDDTAGYYRAQELALALNDSTPEEERRRSPGAPRRLAQLADIVARNTQDEGLDSLKISNVAYELWYANTVKQRVYGRDSITRAEIEDVIQKRKMSSLQGQYSYVPTKTTSSARQSSGALTYTSKGALSPGTLPVNGTITYITAMPSLCHVETGPRTREEAASKNSRGCLSKFARLRNLKHEFPDMEIIVVSNTYGTVGQLGPLTPAQEADTLAKLLAFHRMPAQLVVEETPYYRLPAPDHRRIDSETPNSVALGCPVWYHMCNRIIDKDGYKVVPYRDDDEWFKRFYTILKNRPSQ